MDDLDEYGKEMKLERESIEKEYKDAGKKVPKPKFTKGDLVKITDDWFTYYSGKVGKVTWDVNLRRTVNTESGLTYVYHIMIKGENSWLPVCEEQIELYEGSVL